MRLRNLGLNSLPRLSISGAVVYKLTVDFTGPPMPTSYGHYGPRRPLRQEDVILEANAANPDFVIPGASLGRGGARGRGRGGTGRSVGQRS